MLSKEELGNLFNIVDSNIIESDCEMTIPLCIIIAIAQGWPRFKNFKYWGTVKRTRKEIRQKLDYMAQGDVLKKTSVKPTTYFYGPKYIEFLMIAEETSRVKEKRKELKENTTDRFLFDLLDQEEEKNRIARLKTILNLD